MRVRAAAPPLVNHVTRAVGCWRRWGAPARPYAEYGRWAPGWHCVLSPHRVRARSRVYTASGRRSARALRSFAHLVRRAAVERAAGERGGARVTAPARWSPVCTEIRTPRAICSRTTSARSHALTPGGESTGQHRAGGGHPLNRGPARPWRAPLGAWAVRRRHAGHRRAMSHPRAARVSGIGQGAERRT